MRGIGGRLVGFGDEVRVSVVVEGLCMDTAAGNVGWVGVGRIGVGARIGSWVIDVVVACVVVRWCGSSCGCGMIGIGVVVCFDCRTSAAALVRRVGGHGSGAAALLPVVDHRLHPQVASSDALAEYQRCLFLGLTLQRQCFGEGGTSWYARIRQFRTVMAEPWSCEKRYGVVKKGGPNVFIHCWRCEEVVGAAHF